MKKVFLILTMVLGILLADMRHEVRAHWDISINPYFTLAGGGFYIYAGYSHGSGRHRYYSNPFGGYGYYGMGSNATFKPIESYDSTLNQRLAELGEMQKQDWLEAKNRGVEQFIPAPLPPEETPQAPPLHESKPEIGKIQSQREM